MKKFVIDPNVVVRKSLAKERWESARDAGRDTNRPL